MHEKTNQPLRLPSDNSYYVDIGSQEGELKKVAVPHPEVEMKAHQFSFPKGSRGLLPKDSELTEVKDIK